ncbi:MAG TPA: hypothetical protein VND41_00480 [Nitrososphaerales archaeon]|nr:hypothetical protein [Nitrososphaerales archaeon]
MVDSEKDGRGREGRARPSALRLFPVLFTLVLLISFQGANAAVQVTSGVTQQMGNILPQGNTSYEVLYSYPSTADVGTNLTIALTLHITAFSGQIEYILGYALEAQLFIGGYELNSTIFGPSGFNSSAFLYPGAYWGPNNFTFPLTQVNSGLAKGQSANASLNIILRDTVYYGVPVLRYFTEPAMEAQGGSLLIENPVASTTTSTSTSSQGGGQTLLPYALLGSGAVLMVAAAFLPRGPRSAQASQK